MRRLHAEVRREVRAARARRQRQARPRRHPRDRVRRAGAAAGARRARRRAARRGRRCRCLRCLRAKNLLPADAARRAGATPTSSCATSSTGCSTSTTRSATTCPRTARTARCSRACAASPSWDAFFDEAQAPPRRGDAALPGGVRRARSSTLEAWPEHPRLAALRASQRYAALPEDSQPPPRRGWCRRSRAPRPATPDPEATHRARRRPARGDRQPRRLPRAAGREPEALERVARIIGASSWAAEFVTRHPLLLDELLDDRRAVRAARLESFAKSLRAQLAAHAGRRRAADERAARAAPGAGVPPAGAGPRRAAHRREAGRPPVGARRPGARGDAARWRGRTCAAGTARRRASR